MKKITRRNFLAVSTAGAVLSALAISGCGASSSSEAETSSTTGEEASSSTESEQTGAAEIKVGIVNWVDHASLNQIVAAVKAQLDAVNASQSDIKFVYDGYEANAQADGSILNQIASDLIADEIDVIVAVATPVAVVMQTATEGTGIPVVFSAVTDPELEGLTGNDYVTGTSDALNTEAIMKLILAANADAKKIGLLYDIGQSSSTQAIADAKAFCDANGLEYVEKNGTNNSEIILAAEALVGDGVDAVFTPSDNTVMTAQLAIYETFVDAQIPHYGGADSFALNGAFCGYGVDYVQLGTATADIISQIFVDGKMPGEIPFQTFDSGIATVNTETCAAIGLDLATIKTAFEPLSTEFVEITTQEDFE